ncbi:MAG TPA: class I SAM-dependent methyltransferase [Humisphaera sp.]
MRCKICGETARVFDEAEVLGRYVAEYLHCSACGFVFVGRPHWLTEAYADVIVSSDLGTVHRAMTNAPIVKALIDTFHDPSARFLDYGAGFGMFVRRMRDLGYNFFYHDKYCQNLFAGGHEADPTDPSLTFELVTSFEVMEHLVEPLDEVRVMLARSRSLLVSTEIVPDPPPRIVDWGYYSPRHGQHIAFYSRRSLEMLGRTFGLKLYTNGSNLHLFTPRDISKFLFKLLMRPKVCGLLEVLRPRASLLGSDFNTAQGKYRPPPCAADGPGGKSP